MVQGCGKLMNSLNSDRRGNFHRLSGIQELSSKCLKQGVEMLKSVRQIPSYTDGFA